MCGIVGIASNSNCTNALIEGLKLAYRGRLSRPCHVS